MKLLLCALLIACGSDKKAEPAAGSSAPPPAPVTLGSGETPKGAAPTADNQACKLLLKADAEAWIGHPLDENEGRAMPVGWDCKYRTHHPFSSVTLLLYTADGARVMEQQKAAKMFGPAPVDVPGIGTQTVRAADNNIVGIVANGKLAWLLLTNSSKDKPTTEATETLAKAIAARM